MTFSAKEIGSPDVTVLYNPCVTSETVRKALRAMVFGKPSNSPIAMARSKAARTKTTSSGCQPIYVSITKPIAERRVALAAHGLADTRLAIATNTLLKGETKVVCTAAWYAKKQPTVSHALALVRRCLWSS